MYGMHHYGRVVSDLERALTFYCGLLGFNVLVDEDLSGLEIDAQVQLLNTNMRTVMVNRRTDLLPESTEPIASRFACP